ncbi:MAG: MarR family transcriptional regulator [Croceitalea sp.]|nr:MarR family transcriptional regulator [Croceitalea sp.]NNM18637.1 MarR family transcriptional regulator [Croceitalea sp.]
MNVEEVIKTTKQIPLESRTIIHLTLVHNMISEAMGHALKPFDVSLQQFNVLRILRGQNGVPANLSTLNERMVSKMSNTTRLVDKLILKGLVNRVVCKTNRRKVEITITENGKASLMEMDLAVKQAEKSVLENFNTTELKELNQLLDKF